MKFLIIAIVSSLTSQKIMALSAGSLNKIASGRLGKRHISTFWAQEILPQHPNPLIRGSALPPFAEIKPQHIEEAVNHLTEVVQINLAHIENNPDDSSFASLYERLEEIAVYKQRIWSPIEHLNSVKDSPQLREVYEKVEPQIVNLDMQVEQNEAVYRKLLKLHQEQHELTAEQKRIVELRLQKARLAGVGLRSKKNRFMAISKELAELSTKFNKNVLDSIKKFELILETQEDTAGLPTSFLQMAAQNYSEKFNKKVDAERGPWLVRLDNASYFPFMRFSKRRDLREKLYRAFVTVASEGKFDNTPLIRRILQIRKEQATILGFSNYAELSMTNKMAKNASEVYKLLEELRDACHAQGKKEYVQLSDFTQRHGCSTTLAHWDYPFWAQRMKEETFDLDEEKLRRYFPLAQVMDGMFALAETLFAIKIKKQDADKVQVWHPDVSFYQVYNKEGEHIASFYLDPYSRPQEKVGGAWVQDAVNRRATPDGIVKDIPVVHINANFIPPAGDTPSILNFNNVRTIFHEFGHALHIMLTRVDYPEIAGISGVEWDVVELPSMFMQNFIYLESVIKSISRHVDTGESLPADTLAQLQASKNFHIASATIYEIFENRSDLEIHDSFDPDHEDNIYSVIHKIAEETKLPIPLIPEDKNFNSSLHIFAHNYAAGLYSYIWSEVMAADTFAVLKEHGFSTTKLREIGQRYLDTILSAGGSAPAAELFKKFHGRAPSTQALLEGYGLRE